MTFRPSMAEACRAKCFECTADFADGRRDCYHTDCPIYFRMPYRSRRPDIIKWLFGAWSTKHIKRAEKLGLTHEEYIANVIIKNKKYKVSTREACRAKCFRCMGDYYMMTYSKAENNEDNLSGRMECEIKSCPIYYWTPYRIHEPDYSWMLELSHTKKHRSEMAILHLTPEAYLERLTNV